MTNKLSQKTDDLKATNERLSALIELNLQLGSELDPQRLLQGFGTAAREIIGAPAFHHRNSRRNGLPAAMAVHAVVWTPVRRRSSDRRIRGPGF